MKKKAITKKKAAAKKPRRAGGKGNEPAPVADSAPLSVEVVTSALPMEIISSKALLPDMPDFISQ